MHILNTESLSVPISVTHFKTGLKNQNNISPGALYLQGVSRNLSRSSWLGFRFGQEKTCKARSLKLKWKTALRWCCWCRCLKNLLQVSLKEELTLFLSSCAATFLRARACKKAAIKKLKFQPGWPEPTSRHEIEWRPFPYFCHRVIKSLTDFNRTTTFH